ncbi:uncharacterized protein MICPUCDRAFT_21638, partial [Micromonas pusilla CCMP1545]
MDERAQRMRRHFVALGPVFVKLGQVLSTRADLLPAVYCVELAKLQDALPPASAEHAVELIRRELGADPAAFFESFSPEPVAAASLAQVHRATLRSRDRDRGEDGGCIDEGSGSGPRPPPIEVAVKLQRPGLAASVALDATILRGAARVARRFVKLRSDVVGIVDELIGRIYDELDYRREAESLRRFHDTKTRGGGLEGLVRAPLVLDELSTGAVLTMEWIDGARLTDVARLATAGVTPAALLDRGVRCSLHQLLETGFMHSDPHPGNLVVSERGELVYLDFGMVVEVPPRARRAMIRGLVGFVNRDASGVVSDLIELDFLPRDVDATAGAEALRVVFEDAAAATETKPDPDPAGRSRTQTPLNRVRGADDFLGVVSQLSAALSTRGFRLPPYFARILRALAALEGTATTIDRDFKVIERAYPYVLARVLADRSPEARESLRRLVLEPDGRSVRWSRVSRLARA